MTLTTEPRTPVTEDHRGAESDGRSPSGRRRTVIGVALAAAAVGGVAIAALALGGRDADPTLPAVPVAPAVAPVVDPAAGPSGVPADVGSAAMSPRVLEDPHYLDCMRASSGTADGLESRAPTCRAIATQTAGCLREVGATADGIERWIDTCRDRAAEIVG